MKFFKKYQINSDIKAYKMKIEYVKFIKDELKKN